MKHLGCILKSGVGGVSEVLTDKSTEVFPSRMSACIFSGVVLMVVFSLIIACITSKNIIGLEHFCAFRFCLATAYYGISFNIQGLGLSIYLTQFVYSLIELPAKGTVYYLLDKIGRRPTQMGALLCAAICLGINLVIPKGKPNTPG